MSRTARINPQLEINILGNVTKADTLSYRLNSSGSYTPLAIGRITASASAQQMADAPRLHHQYLPDRVQLEPGALSDEVRQQLHGMGHELQELNDSYGNMQVIVHDYVSSITQAASDPRGIGTASVE